MRRRRRGRRGRGEGEEDMIVVIMRLFEEGGHSLEDDFQIIR